MPFTATTLALAFSAAFAVPPPPPKAIVLPMPIAKVETVRQRVEAYFSDIPIMAAIAGCESHYKQFNMSGRIFRGEINDRDVGIMQINEDYHLEDSRALGFDVHTIKGNLEFARYLYEREGVAPWSSSSYCWSKSNANLARTSK